MSVKISTPFAQAIRGGSLTISRKGFNRDQSSDLELLSGLTSVVFMGSHTRHLNQTNNFSHITHMDASKLLDSSRPLKEWSEYVPRMSVT
jgi:hypothetical protein